MSEDETQNAFKEQVKQWLKSNGHTYGWMADKCGISEITFRNWMSQKSIPPLKMKLLERTMNSIKLPESASAAPVLPASGVRVDATLSLTIRLQAELYRRLEAKAAQCGQTAGDLIAQAINALVEE